jgi:hypothetical protein
LYQWYARSTSRLSILNNFGFDIKKDIGVHLWRRLTCLQVCKSQVRVLCLLLLQESLKGQKLWC